MKSPGNSFLLLYASQSGQAKAIAEEIHEKAPSFGLKARLFCLSLTDKRFSIEKEPCVVFIVSTTGDGEPPDTAKKFFGRLNRQTLKDNHLKHLSYALLALGDSNYIKFCLFGRTLEKRLKTLSADQFYPTGYGDDAYGIETAVDPWICNLWPALRKQLGLMPCEIQDIHLNLSDSPARKMEEPISISDIPSVISDIDVAKCSVPKLLPSFFAVEYDSSSLDLKIEFRPDARSLPSLASPLSSVNIVAAQRLTYGEDVKLTLELTLKFKENESIAYVPGDSFGFICPNSSAEVDSLLSRLGIADVADRLVRLKLPTDCKKKLPSHIPPDLSMRRIFTHCLEIRSVPKKVLLRQLAEYCSNAKEKECLLFLCSTSGAKYYTDCVRKPNLCIMDILLNYPTCQPPVETILEYLPCLKPRFYSVSSSPLDDPDSFKILFNVLRMERREGRRTEREGVCTGWFCRLSSHFLEQDLSEHLANLDLSSEKNSILVYKRQNSRFLFPDQVDRPLIMVGPGTGIAPFMAFLRHRSIQSVLPLQKSIWLFYGCRWADRDYLFKSELQGLCESGVLSHLVVSHSREVPTQSRYVHESIRERAVEMAGAVQNGARIMVCGDAQHMAHDVQQAFIDVIARSMNLPMAEAKSYVTQLQMDSRYVNDVWL